MGGHSLSITTLPAGSPRRQWLMPRATSSVANTNDATLLRQMAAGDERAAGALYDRYGRALYAVAYRIAGQKADAEEVVMEAFAQAWREAQRFEPGRGSVAAWLTMIVRSRALDLVRSRDRRQRITAHAAREEPESAPAMSAWAGNPGTGVEHAEQRGQIEAALQALSAPQRQAIELAFYDGLSQSEIAERLKEPLGTIKTRVRLGMQKLRDALRPYYLEQGA